MNKYDKGVVVSSICDLEAWLEFTTDQQHRPIVEKVVWRLKILAGYDREASKTKLRGPRQKVRGT